MLIHPLVYITKRTVTDFQNGDLPSFLAVYSFIDIDPLFITLLLCLFVTIGISITV